MNYTNKQIHFFSDGCLSIFLHIFNINLYTSAFEVDISNQLFVRSSRFMLNVNKYYLCDVFNSNIESHYSVANASFECAIACCVVRLRIETLWMSK